MPTETKKERNLETLSRETGIPVAKFREALGFPEDITTPEEVKKAYYSAPNGSEAEKLALRKIYEFYMAE